MDVVSPVKVATPCRPSTVLETPGSFGSEIVTEPL